MNQPSTSQAARASAPEPASFAVDRLLPLAYDELRALARSYLGTRSPDHTLHATALVHEAYIRLRNLHDVGWQDRDHFFAVAALAMRQILTNHARDKRAGKRGEGWTRVTLSEAIEPSPGSTLDLIQLNDLLDQLARLDKRQSQVLELRLFSGMTPPRIARVLGVSVRTVERELRMARAWLGAQLAE